MGIFRVQCKNLFDRYAALTRNQTQLQQVSNVSSELQNMTDRIQKLAEILQDSGCNQQICRALIDLVPSDRNITNYKKGDDIAMGILKLK